MANLTRSLRSAALGAIVLGTIVSMLALGTTPAPAETAEHTEFDAFPEALSFGGTSVGGQDTLKATFENRGHTALTVQAAHAPASPFEAKGLPSPGARLEPGEDHVVEVTFKPTATGTFDDSIGLTIDGEAFTVSLSGVGTPASSESAPTPPAPVIPTPVSISVPANIPAPSPASGSQGPPLLSHLQVRASPARPSERTRKLLVAYTLSAAGAVRLSVDRRTASHRCPRGARSCVRWLASAIRLNVSGRPGHNSATLSLAGLAAGEYRLDVTPLARSGASGATQRLTFKIAG
jgi:hypothetical protein